MPKINARSKRKPSGGRYHSTLSKRKHMLARNPTLTKIGETKKKRIRTKGGQRKTVLLQSNKVNIFDSTTKKCMVAEIKNVIDNPASKHFTRRNILTKGAIIETTAGKAKITSRPAQHGTINAVLIK